jgi:hypothetical protein
MRRRDIIVGLSSAVMCSAAARAQQPGGLRRVGVLITFGENDPEGRSWLSAFNRRVPAIRTA